MHDDGDGEINAGSVMRLGIGSTAADKSKRDLQKINNVASYLMQF